MWEFFQPLLFGLIGSEVSIKYMESALIGMPYNILCLHSGVQPTASSSVGLHYSNIFQLILSKIYAIDLEILFAMSQ